MRYLFGFLLGVLTTLVLLAVVFVNTTVAYQSTLFPHHHVVVKAYKLVRK
jgi:hypothetical protein